MLDAALDLFLLARVEGARIRAAEVTAHPAGHRHLGGIVVAAAWAGEALGGTLELAGEAAVVALVDGGVGAVIGHPVIAVVPDVFERFQVVLDVGVLAVADEAAAGDGRIGRLEVQLVVGVDLLLHVEVETVGVVTLVGHPGHHAKLLGVDAAEAGAEVLARGGVEAEAVAGLLFPLVGRRLEPRYDGDGLLAQRLAVKQMGAGAKQGVDGLVHPYVTERDGGAAVLEDLADVVVGLEPHAAGPLHVEDGGDPRLDAIESLDAIHQRLLGDPQRRIQLAPKVRFIARLQGDARQVEAHHTDVVASLVDQLAILLVGAEEGAAAHGGLEGAGHLDHLIMVEDVRVHPLGGTLQRQPLDVVVGIPRLVVEAILDGEHQLREHCGFPVLAKARDAVAEDGALDEAGFPAVAEAEAEGDEGRLAVGGVQGVYLVLQRLEGVVTLLLGAGHGVGVHIADAPLLGHLPVFLPADGHIGRQHLIDTVDGGAAIDVTRHLSDDLGGHCGGGADGLGSVDLRVAHLEAVGQHALQVDQHAVEHGEEGGVVEVVEVQIAALMGLHHLAGQHVAGGVVLGDDAGQQIPLGRYYLGILVGVLVEQGRVGLLHQAADLLGQPATGLAGQIPVVAILDVGTGDRLVVGGHQMVLDPVLDLVNVDLAPPFQLQADGAGNPLAQRRIGLADRGRRPAHRLGNQLGIEWCATSITFDHNRFHAFSPF